MEKQSFRDDYEAWLSKIDSKALSAWLTLKSIAPDIPESYLDRPALTEKLSQGKPVTWLVAPAGYGKSVAMSHWYQNTLPTSKAVGLWLSLDQKDNNAAFLLNHLLEAAEKVVPGVATDALARWSATTFEGSVDSEEVLLLLLDELEDLGCPLVICIDNVHELTDPNAWRVISYLISHIPAGMRLMLASRFVPVPLGKIRLSGKLSFVYQADLVFTHAETVQWLMQTGVGDAQQLAPALMDRTKGWIAGLTLWLVSYQMQAEHGTVISELEHVGQEELADYLLGEVLDQLPPELDEFLINIAPLDNFNAELCDVCLQRNDSHKFIRELQQRNLFIENKDDRTGLFSLHPLFSELLASRGNAEQYQQLHSRAFQWLREHDYRIEALKQARLGHLGEEVFSWIEEEADRILSDLDTASLLAWFELVGLDLISRSVKLQILHCWSLLVSYQYGRAQAYIEVLKRIENIEDLYPGQLEALDGYLRRGQGDYATARRLCERSLERLPEDRFSIRIFVCSTLLNIELVEGQPDKARHWNRLEFDIARQHQCLEMEVLANYNYARIEQLRGNIDRSRKIVEEGLKLAQPFSHQSRLFPRARLMMYRAFLQWLSGDVNRAELDAHAGLAEAIKCHDPTSLYGYSLLALIHTGNQQHSAALAALAQAERLMQRWQVAAEVYQPWLAVVKANVWMGQNKVLRATGSLDMAAEKWQGRPMRSEMFPMLPDFYLASRARLHLMCRENESAQECIKQLLASAQPGIMKLFAALVNAALAGQGKAETNSLDEDQVKSVLQDALSYAEKEGLGILYNRIAEPLTSLVPQQLLKATPVENQGAALSPAKPYQDMGLSEREYDVLQLIATGCSNQDIADKLFISLHTVKTHARKINSKLGAKSRTQAIVRAREMEIL